MFPNAYIEFTGKDNAITIPRKFKLSGSTHNFARYETRQKKKRNTTVNINPALIWQPEKGRERAQTRNRERHYKSRSFKGWLKPGTSFISRALAPPPRPRNFSCIHTKPFHLSRRLSDISNRSDAAFGPLLFVRHNGDARLSPMLPSSFLHRKSKGARCLYSQGMRTSSLREEGLSGHFTVCSG